MLAVVAAGSAATATAAPAGSKLALQANPFGQLTFVEKSLRAKVGRITIVFTNRSPVRHDVGVFRAGRRVGRTAVFSGGTRSLRLTLPRAVYAYYCTIPGHREAGMLGRLIVS